MMIFTESFRDGKQEAEYEGPRTVEAFSHWLELHVDGKAPKIEQIPFLDESGATALTVATFDGFIKEHPENVLVSFCRTVGVYCANVATLMKLLNPELEKRNVRLPSFAKVDADLENGLIERFGITAIPSLFLFRDGDVSLPTVFEGELSISELTNWIQRKSRPISLQIETSDELLDFRLFVRTPKTPI